MEPSERLAIVEHRLSAVEKNYQGIDQKLDQLISLRDKGVGAFWVASALAGVGGLSIVSIAFKWFKTYLWS